MTKAIRVVCVSLSVLAATFGATSSGNAECTGTNCVYVIRIVVPAGAGGATDMVARTIAPSLERQLGRRIIVENIPGAGGAAGTQRVMDAAPDGTTLLMLNTSTAVNTAIYEKQKIDIVRDLVPIAGVARIPEILVTAPSMPAKTVSELVAYAKNNPGKVGIASAGRGSPSQLAGELLTTKTGINARHIPFQGSVPAMVGVAADETLITFVPAVDMSIDRIKSGQLRALGITGTARLPALPDVPTMAETIPAYNASGWIGLVAPKNTRPDFAEQLNRAVNAALAEPGIKEQLVRIGATVVMESPADFGKLIADETEKWTEVTKAMGSKAQ